MNVIRNIIHWMTTAVIALLILYAGRTVDAALSTFGPPAPGTQGFPEWYQDFNGVALGPCWDFNGFCALLPPFCPPSQGLGCLGTPINLDPAIPINDANFPLETFYFNAATVANIGPDFGATFTQHITLEGSFNPLLSAVVPGQQITFLRINSSVTGTLIPNSSYSVVHPYGAYTFATDAAGNAANTRVADPLAATPGDFGALLTTLRTNIGPLWLIDTAGFHTDAATGNVYIGLGPLSAVTVTGSPSGNNFVSITGPCANGGGDVCTAVPVFSTLTDNVFFLTGKMVSLIASPGSIAFSAQKAGVASTPITVTITNRDIVNSASLGLAAITGTDAADFTVTADTCSNSTVAAAGGVCTFGVTFSEASPGVNGAKSAAVNFPVTAPNRPPVLINLSGTIDNGPPAATVTTPSGDVTGDGVVDIADALKVLHMAAGFLSPSASEVSFGDVAPLVNGKPQPDGKIDLGDVVVVLRRAVGLVSW